MIFIPNASDVLPMPSLLCRTITRFLRHFTILKAQNVAEFVCFSLSLLSQDPEIDMIHMFRSV